MGVLSKDHIEIDGKKAWIFVIGAVLGGAVCSTPVAMISLSSFLKPLSDEFGWGRGEIMFALSLVTLSLGLASPIAGKLIDRHGSKVVIVTSAVAFSIAMFLTPLMVRYASIYGFYFAFILIGVLGAGSNTVAFAYIVAGWFQKHRGLALGVALSGTALGAVFIPMLATFVIQNYDWEVAFYALATLPLIFGIPSTLLLIQDPPKTHIGTEETQPGLTLREALQTSSMRTLIAIFFLVATCIHGIQLHLTSLISDRGFDPAVATVGISILFACSVLARIGAGWLLDRFFAPRVAFCLFALACIGVVLLYSAENLYFLYFAAAVIGFGAGVESDLLGYLVSRYFGRRSFGQIYGVMFTAFMAGTAFGPLYYGMIFDQMNAYGFAIATTGIGLVVGCGLFLTLPKFPPESAGH